jgi:lipopolysaccharide transport system ATP-binding protein
MYTRLAFSIAAHLEPEILLVDEVLAVGDADFQKKSLGRMSELGESGRTVLFVSHSMPAILRLCPRVILLDAGGVVADGLSSNVVRTYLQSGLGSTAEREWGDVATAPGDDAVRLKAVRVRAESGEVSEEIDIRQPITLELEYWHLATDAKFRPFANVHLYNDEGVCLFVSADHVNRHWYNSPRRQGVVRAICRIPGNYFAEGRISVMAAVSSYDPTLVHAKEPDAVSFVVVDRSAGDGARGQHPHDLPGVVRPLLEWTIETDSRDMALRQRSSERRLAR